MSVPVAAPLRDGARFHRITHISEHRNERYARLNSTRSTAGTPEVGAAACQNRAAIKPSLTVSWLILPSSAQAP
jgi:hypothetical protein